jgi:arylsulfatase A-like enzyme
LPPFDTLYDSTYTGGLTPEVYQHGQKVVSGEIVPSPRDVEHLLALYDGEITYWDQQLYYLLARLSAEGLLNNALVVVTSDHGQMFGEHGKWLHRNSLYEEVLRVPLFLHYPGVVPANKVIDTPVFTADLMPTILDLVGLPVPGGLDGVSLKPLLLGSGESLADRPIYAEMEGEPSPVSPGHWIAPLHDLRSVKENGWKYVFEVNHPEGNALLKIQSQSVYEGFNLIAEYPQKSVGLHAKVFDWFRMPTDFNFIPSVRYR